MTVRYYGLVWAVIVVCFHWFILEELYDAHVIVPNLWKYSLRRSYDQPFTTGGFLYRFSNEAEADRKYWSGGFIRPDKNRFGYFDPYRDLSSTSIKVDASEMQTQKYSLWRGVYWWNYIFVYFLACWLAILPYMCFRGIDVLLSEVGKNVFANFVRDFPEDDPGDDIHEVYESHEDQEIELAERKHSSSQ